MSLTSGAASPSRCALPRETSPSGSPCPPCRVPEEDAARNSLDVRRTVSTCISVQAVVVGGGILAAPAHMYDTQTGLRGQCAGATWQALLPARCLSVVAGIPRAMTPRRRERRGGGVVGSIAPPRKNRKRGLA